MQKTNEDITLTITSVDGDGETTGSLTATGGYDAAGIGGGYKSNGYNIVINGGTITASGNHDSAAIGGGSFGSGRYITINGGIVNATGGSSGGAGIGGGCDHDGSYIEINDGVVTAIGGNYGAGIGGGYNPSEGTGYGSNITINGGTVNASGINGAGIGGAAHWESTGGSGSSIYIKGGSVIATSTRGNPIGGAIRGATSDIYISPNVGIILQARYSNSDEYTLYATEEDITDLVTATSYFESNEIGSIYNLSTEIAGLAIYDAESDDYIIDDSVTEDFNANDLIALNVLVDSDIDLSVGSVNFALKDIDGLFTLSDIISTSSSVIETNADEKTIAITGMEIDSAASDVTVATVFLKVKDDIETTADVEVGVDSEGKNYIIPTNSAGEYVPEIGDNSTINLYNLKATFNSDNSTFADDDVTEASVRYNEAGLYADNTWEEIVSVPTPTANTGYRLAEGTEDEPLWIDNTNGIGYKDSDAVEEILFTADTTFTVNTIARYVVTIVPADSLRGTLSYSFDDVLDESITNTITITVDEGTTLDDFNFDFETADDAAYIFTGFNITYTDGVTSSTSVSKEEFADTEITQSMTLTPIIDSNTFTLTYDSEGQTSELNFISGVDTSNNNTISYRTDIVFEVADFSNNITVYSVYYSVNGNTPVELTPVSGTYTIKGTEILGDVELVVTAKKYYEITFKADGVGASATSITGYAWDGESGIYVNVPSNESDLTKYTTSEIIENLKACEGYRLANDTTEPLWADGSNNYTTANVIGSVVFEEDTELTANYIKTYVVTFEDNGHGSVGTSELIIDENTTIGGSTPTVTPNNYYSFKEWQIGDVSYTDDELKEYEVTEDVIVIAVFEPSAYSVTFAESDYGTFTATSGVDADGNGTYLTDIKFTFDTEETIENIYYSINGVVKELTASYGVYTIPGEEVIGAVSVYYDTDDVAVFTFYIDEDDSAKGSLTGTTAFILQPGESLTETQVNSIGLTESTGYVFDHWVVTEEGDQIDANTNAITSVDLSDDNTSGSAIEVTSVALANSSSLVDETYTDEQLVNVEADRNLKFKAVFELDDFVVTDENDIVNIISGVEDGVTHINTPITFTISEDVVVTYVGYTVGDDSTAIQLTADDEGVYTIPESAVTGDIAIITTLIMNGDENATFEFISHEYYLGEISAAEGRQIAVLTADKLNEGNYAITGYGDFYYSNKYEAYVIWVDEDETATTLNAKMITSANDPTTITYSGDINGTGVITAGDAGIINDILKDVWTGSLSDAQLFMLDVERVYSDTENENGYQQIKTSDVTWILRESIDANE